MSDEAPAWQARDWLEARGWIAEYVERVHVPDHYAVGHTHLGVFNVWGEGRTVGAAVLDAIARLDRMGKSVKLMVEAR